MIERQFVNQNLKEFRIQEYISATLGKVGHSHTKLQKTPLGEKIIVYASRPGLVVGRKGMNIKKLTTTLKKEFGLENPQIEINEVENINLDAQIVAERIVSSLEKFGTQRFKGVGHKVIQDVMNSGALGVEVLISGKVPSSRAKTWRFYNGYLKKCGDVADTMVDVAESQALLKTGVVGVKVKIMLPGTVLPDKIHIREEEDDEKESKTEVAEEVTEESDKKVIDDTEKDKVVEEESKAEEVEEPAKEVIDDTEKDKVVEEESKAEEVAEKESTDETKNKEEVKDD